MVSVRNQLQSASDRLAWLAVVGLALAGLVVGLAIELDGSAARAVNGVGGVLWIGSGLVLIYALRKQENWRVLAPIALGVGLVLSYVVRPSDIVMASLGFVAGGMIVAAFARKPLLTALLMPASWLPLHLFLAITRSVVREMTGGESAVRTDPPPTAALVPFMMVVAAAVGGIIVYQLRVRKGQRQLLGTSEN